MQTSVGRWKQAGLTRIARLVQSQDPTIHEQKHPGVVFTAQLRLSKYIWINGYLRFPIISLGGHGAMDISKNIYASSPLPAMNLLINHWKEIWDTFCSYLNFCDEFETKGGANVKGTDHELRRKKPKGKDVYICHPPEIDCITFKKLRTWRIKTRRMFSRKTRDNRNCWKIYFSLTTLRAHH